VPKKICPGVNSPCSCLKNSSCALLSVDPLQTGNVIYTCMNPEDASNKASAIQSFNPNVPASVITTLPPVCGTTGVSNGGIVGGAVGASTSTATTQSSTVGTGVSSDDLETYFMWCANNSLSSTANTRQCTIEIVAAATGKTTDPSANPTVDISLSVHHVISCPPGVTLTQTDYSVDICRCFHDAILATSTIDFKGVCTGTIVASTAAGKKRATSGSATQGTTTLNTNSGTSTTSTTGASATTGVAQSTSVASTTSNQGASSDSAALLFHVIVVLAAFVAALL